MSAFYAHLNTKHPAKKSTKIKPCYRECFGSYLFTAQIVRGIWPHVTREQSLIVAEEITGNCELEACERFSHGARSLCEGARPQHKASKWCYSARFAGKVTL